MEDNTIRSVQRIFTLLETLAERGSMGITELSIATGLNKTTVFRQVNTLVSMGYVKKDESTEKYRLTFKLLEAAGKMLEHDDMRSIVRPYLEELAAKTGETVHLVQREGIHIVYIDKVEPTVNSVRMVSKVGMRQLLYCTAVGKALLAQINDSEIQSIWENSPIHPLTPHTLVDLDAFMTEISKIRSQGYALDNEENELGVVCVAVALRDYIGQSHYAISISAPVSRMTPDRIVSVTEQLMHIKSVFL